VRAAQCDSFFLQKKKKKSMNCHRWILDASKYLAKTLFIFYNISKWQFCRVKGQPSKCHHPIFERNIYFSFVFHRCSQNPNSPKIDPNFSIYSTSLAQENKPNTNARPRKLTLFVYNFGLIKPFIFFSTQQKIINDF
jgi:hypothetical protein